MSDPKYIQEPASSDVVPPDNQIDELFKLVEGIDDAEIQAALEVARKHNATLKDACKFILAESDRIFNQGNAEIRRLAEEKDELVVKLRKFIRDLEGKSAKQTVIEIKELLGYDGDGHYADHDCPSCACWETDNLEEEPERD